ncbi:large ribosomal subunit protein uL18m [Cylas formicarius]|uniref:large ribosomal subunit protein uL18m n=1 Tax=Cylas formicarius TaxID=197179 RepID=UPI0029583A2A|nr:large ribosomal subunit protein uL18m [Cylas formicarius]
MLKLQNIGKLSKTGNQIRPASTFPKNDEISPMFTNRNPRNLEKMRIGYKPDGYHLERPGKTYWHKLVLTSSGRYAKASIHHFQNGEVISASTSEWGIKKQLYRCKDTSAYINLARVLAHRCLQCGLIHVTSDIIPRTNNGKVAQFLKVLEANGVSLSEPPQFKAAYPWDCQRPEKPWEIVEE